MPDANIRALHVLALNSRATTTATSSTAAEEPAPRRVVPAGPVKTRETASAGCHRTLAAHRAVAPPRQEAPALAVVVVRHEQARLDLAEQVFPDVEQDQGNKTP
ncbi:hypothetical protein ACFQ7J_30495 [Streptomyces sp. NPDC056501]|uniref:hypothetical protein n=1 Tax=Streptomyces sp. NPDC056501 TaxID=3345841 RepID=UPI00367FD729